MWQSRFAFALLAAVGCGNDSGDAPSDAAPDPAVDAAMQADAPIDATPLAPPACANTWPTYVLVASDPSYHAFEEIEARSYGEQTYCLQLDGRMLSRAYFQATTDKVSGETTPWTLVLRDLDGTVLAEGNDIAIGNSNTQAHASVSREFTADVHEVLLEVRARDAAATTAIGLALIDPLE